MKKQILIDEGFLSLTRDGVFINGKKTTTYNGQQIFDVDSLLKVFFVQQTYRDIIEIRVMQSNVNGKMFSIGKPMPSSSGGFVWMQIVSSQVVSPWFSLGGTGRKDLSAMCAYQCIWSLYSDPQWRDVVLKSIKHSVIAPAITKTENTR